MANLSSQKARKYTSTTNIYELQEWCRRYDRENRYPCDTVWRFAIAFYQVHQGFGWTGANRSESFAAACIHLLVTAERLCIGGGVHANIDKLDLREVYHYTSVHSDKDLLCHLSLAQQHVIYVAQGTRTKRASRYDPAKAAQAISSAIINMMGRIHPDERSQTIEDATKIMTGVL